MSHRKDVLRLVNTPEGLDAIADRLNVLSESFFKVRESKLDSGQPVERLNEDYKGICDLATNVDLARAERTVTEAYEDHAIVTDPLAQLKVARQYGVLDSETANRLQDEFKASVRDIVGRDLKPGEIKRLYQLMTGFNPFQPK